MSEKNTGRVTIPTNLDVVPETIELMKRWGADAIRDCDGTEFPEELTKTGAKIYATYYTTRKDNAWAKANPDDNVGNDNGDNLQKLTEIKDNSKMFVHGAPDSFIQSLTALLGVDAKKADTMEKSQSNLLYAIDTNRKSVSGVDEDEEGSDMIVFQNMLFNQYKMLNVLNEVLDKWINETGV